MSRYTEHNHRLGFSSSFVWTVQSAVVLADSCLFPRLELWYHQMIVCGWTGLYFIK